MKTSTQKKLVEAMQRRIDEVLGAAGHTPASLPAAERQFYKEMSKELKGKLDQAAIVRMFRSASLRTLWQEMEGRFKERPEPTPEQLKKALAEIEAIDITSMLRMQLRAVLRKLQPAPPGKSPELNSQQQQEALAKVQGLVKKGLSRKRAYAKVASEYGLHWRTIQNLSRRAHKQNEVEA